MAGANKLVIERNEKLEAERLERVEKVKDNAEAVANLNNHFDILMQAPIDCLRDELHQFGPDGKFHQFAEIDQDKVEMFVMINLEDRTKRFDMSAEGKQIFHFYRHTIFAGGTPLERRAKVYCFGWKDKETGATAYHWIMPDDRLVISDKDIDITKFNL